jgi:hypothetical protein
MFTVGIEDFVTGFLVAGLVFFVLVWLYYDRRDRLFYDRQRLRHVHHCVKCDTLYTSPEAGVVECPSCGFKNPSLRF